MKTLLKNCSPLSIEFKDAMNSDAKNHTQKTVLFRGGKYIPIHGMVSMGDISIVFGYNDVKYILGDFDKICILD